MTRVRELVSPLAVAVLVLVAVVGVLGRGVDVRLVPVLSGSMDPTTPMGALAVTTPVEAAEVEEGDVIAFAPPPPYTTVGDRPVLHRVVEVDVLEDGTRTARTKGDANAEPDPWTIHLGGGGDLARSHLAVPYVGFAVAGGTLATGAVLGGLLLLRLTRELRRREEEPCTCPLAQDGGAAPA